MDKCKDGGNRQRGYPLMQDMTERDMCTFAHGYVCLCLATAKITKRADTLEW